MTDVIQGLIENFDAIQTLLLVAIFLTAGIVKGFLGIGLPAAAMAFLTLTMPPTEAIPLLWLSIFATIRSARDRCMEQDADTSKPPSS